MCRCTHCCGKNSSMAVWKGGARSLEHGVARPALGLVHVRRAQLPQVVVCACVHCAPATVARGLIPGLVLTQTHYTLYADFGRRMSVSATGCSRRCTKGATGPEKPYAGSIHQYEPRHAAPSCSSTALHMQAADASHGTHVLCSAASVARASCRLTLSC